MNEDTRCLRVAVGLIDLAKLSKLAVVEDDGVGALDTTRVTTLGDAHAERGVVPASLVYLDRSEAYDTHATRSLLSR